MKSHIVYTDFLINSADSAKTFVEDLGLPFDEKAYNEFVKPDLWHG